MSANRKFLGSLVAVAACLGAGVLAVMFLSSLGPTSTTGHGHLAKIPIASVPSGGFVEIKLDHFHLFITDPKAPRAFVIPHHDNKYGLPDPTWDHPNLLCSSFRFKDGRFTCDDPGLSTWWRTNLQWDQYGRNLGERFLPDLRAATLEVQGHSILLDPERQ